MEPSEIRVRSQGLFLPVFYFLLLFFLLCRFLFLLFVLFFSFFYSLPLTLPALPPFFIHLLWTPPPFSLFVFLVVPFCLPSFLPPPLSPNFPLLFLFFLLHLLFLLHLFLLNFLAVLLISIFSFSSFSLFLPSAPSLHFASSSFPFTSPSLSSPPPLPLLSDLVRNKLSQRAVLSSSLLARRQGKG